MILVAVTISTSKTMTICSLYLPPSDNLNSVSLSRLINQLPTPFVICGDFNCHSITWDCEKNNSRGDRIDDFITENNICLLNDGSYTYLLLIFVCVLRIFLWRLWLNRIRMVVIIFIFF